MENILLKCSEFRDTEANFNSVTQYKYNLNSQINVNFYYLQNEINPRIVAITVLEYKPKYPNQHD